VLRCVEVLEEDRRRGTSRCGEEKANKAPFFTPWAEGILDVFGEADA
jgi:hypothetical protein